MPEVRGGRLGETAEPRAPVRSAPDPEIQHVAPLRRRIERDVLRVERVPAEFRRVELHYGKVIITLPTKSVCGMESVQSSRLQNTRNRLVAFVFGNSGAFVVKRRKVVGETRPPRVRRTQVVDLRQIVGHHAAVDHRFRWDGGAGEDVELGTRPHETVRALRHPRELAGVAVDLRPIVTGAHPPVVHEVAAAVAEDVQISAAGFARIGGEFHWFVEPKLRTDARLQQKVVDQQLAPAGNPDHPIAHVAKIQKKRRTEHSARRN